MIVSWAHSMRKYMHRFTMLQYPTTDLALLLRDFCGWYFVIRWFAAFCGVRLVTIDDMYENKHLDFKNRHCMFVAGAGAFIRKNPNLIEKEVLLFLFFFLIPIGGNSASFSFFYNLKKAITVISKNRKITVQNV